MKEKYLAISSVVGAWRRIRPELPAASVLSSPSPTEPTADAVDDAPGSEIEAFGRNVAASGDET
jgi:hypothetical protein